MGPKAVTVFTDVQAAMARIASDEPGPAQQYARQDRKWIAKLKERVQNVRMEIRWCPPTAESQGMRKQISGRSRRLRSRMRGGGMDGL